MGFLYQLKKQKKKFLKALYPVSKELQGLVFTKPCNLLIKEVSMEKYCYPAIFKYEGQYIYVTFPDFPDCFTDGKNEEEALDNEKEVLELQKESKNKSREIFRLKKVIGEKSIVSQGPTQYFKEHKVIIKDGHFFTIITNMKEETFKNMCSNFSGRYDWKDAEEAKSKMLQYINDKHSLGFKAYKDEKTALKDNVKIKR